MGDLIGRIALSAGLAVLFMLLWNAVAVPTFGVPALSFWIAWGLWILVGLVAFRFRRSS